MGKELETEEKKPTIFQDSIITGVLHALGHKVIPIKNLNGQVNYEVSGNVSKTIEEIYANCPVGALDVMRSIKLTRSMIFNLRQGNDKTR